MRWGGDHYACRARTGRVSFRVGERDNRGDRAGPRLRARADDAADERDGRLGPGNDAPRHRAGGVRTGRSEGARALDATRAAEHGRILLRLDRHRTRFSEAMRIVRPTFALVFAIAIALALPLPLSPPPLPAQAHG